MVDFARVQKELEECNRDKDVSGISVKPKADTLTHLIGSIPGPLATPYEGGTFNMDIVIPDAYPFEPPKMQFTTKVWHGGIVAKRNYMHVPNIRSAFDVIGYNKHDIPACQLGVHPNSSSQSEAICLDSLKDQWSPALTIKAALLSIQALLSAPEPDDPQDAVVAQQVLKFMEMGFPEALVRSTREVVGGDENMALEKLCSG